MLKNIEKSNKNMREDYCPRRRIYPLSDVNRKGLIKRLRENCEQNALTEGLIDYLQNKYQGREESRLITLDEAIVNTAMAKLRIDAHYRKAERSKRR